MRDLGRLHFFNSPSLSFMPFTATQNPVPQRYSVSMFVTSSFVSVSNVAKWTGTPIDW